MKKKRVNVCYIYELLYIFPMRIEQSKSQKRFEKLINNWMNNKSKTVILLLYFFVLLQSHDFADCDRSITDY